MEPTPEQMEQDRIAAEMGLSSSPQSAGSGNTTIRLPDGSTIEIPDDQVPDFLNSAPGSVVVQPPSEPIQEVPSEPTPETPVSEVPTTEVPTPMSDVESMNSQQQFDYYKSQGLIPENAQFVEMENGQWGYTTAEQEFVVPADFHITKDQLTYLRENDPEVFNAINELGYQDAFKKYGDRIALSQWETKFKSSNPELFGVYKNAGGGQAGIDAVTQSVQVVEETAQENVTELPDGNYVRTEDLERLKTDNPQAHDLLVSGGFKLYDKTLADAYNKIKPYSSSVRHGGHEVGLDGEKIESPVNISTTYDIRAYLRENPNDIEVLKTLGFDDKTIALNQSIIKSEQSAPQIIKDSEVTLNLSEKSLAEYENLSAEDKYSILQSEGIVSPSSGYFGKTQNNEPIVKTDMFTVASASLVALPIGDIIINTLPIVGTIRNWNDMGAVGKTVSILTDVFSIVTVVGSIGAGARSVVETGRVARLMGGLKGAGTGIVREIIAPATVILHPVQTAKSTFVGLRELLEIADFGKLPEAVITTTRGTVRLPVNMATTEGEAKRITETIMDLVKQGEKPVIEVNGVKYELTSSALMKEVGGGLVHSTPQGEMFIKGTTVTENIGKPISEQGLFLANEPLPRFVSQSAFGVKGEMPSIIIFPPSIAKDAISTDKLYMSRLGKVAEFEEKFPVGYEIPPPKYRMYTRLGAEGTKVQILLYEPLSIDQIAKLKSLAIIEDLKAPLSPSLIISGWDKVDTIDYLWDAERVADIIRITNSDVADSLLLAYRNRDFIERTMRQPVTDTMQVRAIDSDGERVDIDSVEVRVIGTPENQRVVPPRVDLPIDIRRVSIPSEVPRITEFDRIPNVPEVPRMSETGREPIPPESARIPETDRVPTIPEVPRVPDLDRVPRVPDEPRLPDVPRVPRPPDRIYPLETPRVPEIPKLEFEEDEVKNKKLEHGFATWRQGKTYWAIPQREDGSFDSDDKIPSGKPFRGTTKFATGKGSVYRTIEYVGKNPPNKTFVDLGFIQYNITSTPDGLVLEKAYPDEEANWDGTNRYTSEEALAQKEQEKQRKGSPVSDTLDLTFATDTPEGKETWFDIIKDDKQVGKVKVVDKEESIYVRDIEIDPEYKGVVLASLDEISELLGKPLDKPSILVATGKALQQSLSAEERDELIGDIVEEIGDVEEEDVEPRSPREERIAKYKAQYSKLKKPRRNVFKEVDKTITKEENYFEPDFEENRERYLGLEILPPQVGGKL